jgi:hypothetical protein
MNAGTRKLARMLSFAAAILAGGIAWKIAACYIANAELQSDMRFISRQMGTTSGLSDPLSEDQLRDAVINDAKADGIELTADKVTAERTVTDTQSIVHLTVDYDGKIDLFVFTLHPHFSLSSSGTVALAGPSH